MPPKAKFTREEMIEKAVGIIVSSGPEKLTARSLADALNTSVRPIFTAFTNMDELKSCVFNYAMDIYHKEFSGCIEPPTFRQIGLAYIHFAVTQPLLFQLLFMKSQEKEISFGDFMKKLDDHYDDTITIVSREIGLTAEKAVALYRNMWLFCHGIATLCATNQCTFTEDEVESMLIVALNGFCSVLQNQ